MYTFNSFTKVTRVTCIGFYVCMNVCMYVCMYVVLGYIHTQLIGLGVCVCVCVYVRLISRYIHRGLSCSNNYTYIYTFYRTIMKVVYTL